MKIASVAEVKAQLSAYIRASEEGPVVITRNGKPAAVLLAVEDDQELERLILAYTPKFRTLLDASRDQIKRGGHLSHEAFWDEVDAEDHE